MVSLLSRIATSLIISTKARSLFIVLQLMWSGLAVCLSIVWRRIPPAYIWFTNDVEVFGYACLVVWSILLGWLLLTTIFAKRYGLNVLVYERKTGILLDRTLNTRNVALRVATLAEIFRGLTENTPDDTDSKLTRIGRNIGRDFARNCLRTYTKEWSTSAEHLFKGISFLLEYDSSSGLGDFNITVQSHHPIMATVKIIHPFTHIDGSDQPDVCNRQNDRFMCGYLEGIFAEFGREVMCTIENCSSSEVILGVREKAGK